VIILNDIKPIFITGVYRSGTTLISRILGNHPQLEITYDSVHFMRFSFNRFNPISDYTNFCNLTDEIQQRLSNRWKIQFDSKKVINQIQKLDSIDYSKIYDIIMTNLLKKSNSKIWGEKTNMAWRKIPDFLKMFPLGKTILIIRDPRDILISYKNMTYEPGLRYLDSIFACLDSFHYAKNFKKLPSKNFHVVKYEELVTNPETTTKKISEFLEIEYDPIMINADKFTDKWNKTWEGNSSFEKSIRTISKQTIGRWKNRISNIELYLLELILKEQMVDFGYELGAIPLTKKEWNELFTILNDDFIKERYDHWLKTGKGHQSYPSDPIEKAKSKINFNDYKKF